MKEFVKKIYKDVIAVIVMLVMMCGFVYGFMDMENFDIHYPISYDGGDGMSYLVNAVALMEGSTTLESDRLGAPYGYYGYDFYASSLHNVDNAILKVIVQFTDEPALAVNILFLLIFPLIALFSYFALRQMKVRPWISVCGALTYTFMPYLFMRGMDHFVLSCYYFVPVSILYCVWIYTDDSFMCFNKAFFKNWKNYFALLLTICIANNGISYYPFFTCFFLIIAGLVKSIKEKKVGYLGKSLVLIVLIAGFMVLSLIPNMMYIRRNGANKDAFLRTLDGVETYSLKIAQLFMPLDAHGSYTLDVIINEYNDNMPLVNENYMSFLGIMGCVGFLVLMVILFMRNIKEDKLYKQQLGILSLLNVAGVLLGTVGGFGSLFGVLVTDMIRCYNRISIFIAFICIAAVCILLNALCMRIGDIKRFSPVIKRVIYGAYIAVVAVAVLWGIWFQYPGLRFDYVNFREYYKSDAAFVARIEEMLPQGAMVYQLPYHEYPEGGPVNDMNDYDLWAGYIHSKDLRWSYGGVLGREADTWLASVNNDNIEEMLSAIRAKGFAGVYIDRRAYEDDDIIQMETELERLLGTKGIISDNSALSFFPVK